MPALTEFIYESFIQHYVAMGARRGVTLAAAEAAGLDSTGNTAYNLLMQPMIKARIRELMQERFGELEITAKRTFEEMGRIAFSDPAELFDAKGQLIPVSKMSPEQRATIASIDFETHFEGRGADAVPVHTVKVKLWDKNDMLKVLARHFKIIHDDKDGLNALAGELASQLRAGRERAQAARRAPVQPVEIVEDARIIEAPPAPPPPPLQEIDDEERIW